LKFIVELKENAPNVPAAVKDCEEKPDRSKVLELPNVQPPMV
jgi:hypothetical protein